jgi:hypothetical protein
MGAIIAVGASMKQISIKLGEGESDWYAQHDAHSYAGLMNTLSRQTKTACDHPNF